MKLDDFFNNQTISLKNSFHFENDCLDVFHQDSNHQLSTCKRNLMKSIIFIIPCIQEVIEARFFP